MQAERLESLGKCLKQAYDEYLLLFERHRNWTLNPNDPQLKALVLHAHPVALHLRPGGGRPSRQTVLIARTPVLHYAYEEGWQFLLLVISSADVS